MCCWEGKPSSQPCGQRDEKDGVPVPPSLGSQEAWSSSSLLSYCHFYRSQAVLQIYDMKHNKKFLNIIYGIVVLFCFSLSSCAIPCALESSSSQSVVCKYFKRKGKAVTSSKYAKGVKV